ncbi:MAG: Hsp20/alpha crystallin family protein [Bacillota bacterium]|nr:Hsp20/alpha crystallin family protein [Bacillota bacterium]
MSVRRWDPFGELQSLREQMNRMWDFLRPGRDIGIPRIDITQDGNDVVVTAEIPGVASKDDIDVTLTADSITLRGDVQREKEVKDEDYYLSERYFGSFSRTVPLPMEVKPGQAKATYKNGVLEVRVPINDEGRKKEHQIKIE